MTYSTFYKSTCGEVLLDNDRPMDITMEGQGAILRKRVPERVGATKVIRPLLE